MAPLVLRVRPIAYARLRPRAIASTAKWVHVDLARQLLTAYEGDRLVYATLVSTGRPPHTTPTGRFRVWYKAIHSPMHGEPDDPYYVDEVPYVMFIRKGIALHGTFWHDRFGHRMSHGCVNLSIADAAWLFAWAPPTLPDGWHAIEPEPAGRPTLEVLIEPSVPQAERAPIPSSLAALAR
jgi:lipoprotein-anchoring transpeptidase ErfK/SrfK